MTNIGYLNLTKNCIKSLQKIGCTIPLKVYCVDLESYNNLKETFDHVYYFESKNQVNSQLTNYHREGWANVTFCKIEIIHNELLKHKHVIFTDGDIVFENNKFIDYCFDQLQDKEAIFQKDPYNEDINSGFMLLKSTDNVKNAFNPENIDKKSFICDQPFVNSILHKFTYKTLSTKLYTHLPIYDSKNNPHMIHFTYVKGSHKKKYMKELGKWFI